MQTMVLKQYLKSLWRQRAEKTVTCRNNSESKSTDWSQSLFLAYLDDAGGPQESWYFYNEAVYAMWAVTWDQTEDVMGIGEAGLDAGCANNRISRQVITHMDGVSPKFHTHHQSIKWLLLLVHLQNLALIFPVSMSNLEIQELLLNEFRQQVRIQ